MTRIPVIQDRQPQGCGCRAYMDVFVKDNIWQLQEAKSKFSQLVEAAIRHKPQFVTKHGDNAVVVLSFEDYKKMIKPQTDIVTFLRNSPLTEIDLTTLRNTDYPGNIEL